MGTAGLKFFNLRYEFLSSFKASLYPTKYPILVFIHGGGYTNGFSWSYIADNLAQRGIIVALVQYRMGGK